MAKTHTEKAGKEPRMWITARQEQPMWRNISVRAIAIVAALIVDALFIMLVTKLNPLKVYAVMFQGTFGNSIRFTSCIRDMVTLLCVGVALAPAFKMRFWNIGAEGQVLMGGLATAVVMIYLGDKLPTGLLFLVMAVASIAAGALWALLPAIFKARWNTNETLFTLMMNYIAIDLVAYCTNIWRGTSSSLGQLNMGTKAGWFPMILGQRYTLNIIIVLLLTVLMYIYLRYSKHGYEITVVGESERTARYAGISVSKVILRTMVISGSLCGICGFLTVAGKDQSISVDTAAGNGFTAIIVAWLAKFNTFIMIAIAFLLIFLEKGAHQIQSSFPNLNDYAADIITGIILFFILGSEFFLRYQVHFRGKKTEASK